MAQIDTGQFKTGLKIEIDNHPYIMVANEFVKPGKGQAFNRTKLKHLISGKVMERTFKSGDKVAEADVLETTQRLLYLEGEDGIFMDDSTYEQITVPAKALESSKKWLLEDTVYEIIFYKGEPVIVTPPTFMELKIIQTDPGARGDTASGRVLKPATVETNATVQVPIFISEEEIIRVDTRTGDYVARAGAK
jgi:elongation factor P